MGDRWTTAFYSGWHVLVIYYALPIGVTTTLTRVKVEGATTFGALNQRPDLSGWHLRTDTVSLLAIAFDAGQTLTYPIEWAAPTPNGVEIADNLHLKIPS